MKVRAELFFFFFFFFFGIVLAVGCVCWRRGGSHLTSVNLHGRPGKLDLYETASLALAHPV